MPPKRSKKKQSKKAEFNKSVQQAVSPKFKEAMEDDFVVVDNTGNVSYEENPGSFEVDFNNMSVFDDEDDFEIENNKQENLSFEDFKKNIENEPVPNDVDFNSIDIQGDSFDGDFVEGEDDPILKNNIPPVNPNEENKVLEPEKDKPQEGSQQDEGGQPDEPVKVDENPVVEENKDVVINQQNLGENNEEQFEIETNENPQEEEVDLSNLNSVNLSGMEELAAKKAANPEDSIVIPDELNSIDSFVNESTEEAFKVETNEQQNQSVEEEQFKIETNEQQSVEEDEFKVEVNEDSVYIDPNNDSIVSEKQDEIDINNFNSVNLSSIEDLEEKKEDKPVLNKEAINDPDNTGVQNQEIKANANVDEDIVDNADTFFRNNWEFNKVLSEVLSKEVAQIKKEMTPLDKLQQKAEEKKEEAKVEEAKGEENKDEIDINNLNSVNLSSIEDLEEKKEEAKAEEKKEEIKAEEQKPEVKENTVENLSVARLYQMGLLRKADGSFFDANEEIKDDLEGNQKVEHMISDEIRQNGAAYVVHLGINKDNTKINKLSISPSMDENGHYEGDKLCTDEVKIEFVDPAKKKQYLDKLQSIKEAVDQNGLTSRDSAKYIALKETLDKKIETLTSEPDANKFKKDFKEIAVKANDYVIEKTGQKANARRLGRIEIAHEIEDLNEAVQNDIDINENFDSYKKLRNDRMRKTVAEKFVKAYAMKRSQLKDPAAKADGENLLNDPDAFEEKVQKAMEQKWFKALYCQEGTISQKRLQEAAETTDINKVFKQISEEAKNPKIDVEKFEEPKRSRPPLRMETYKKDLFIANEVKDDFKNKLADIKHGMDELWFEPYTSDQFKKLKYEVEVAQIMINSGSTFLDYNQMAANIGDAADGYLRHKMSDSKTDNTRGLKRDSFAMQLREIADAMNNGKKADIPEESEMLKEQMKERIVYEQIKTLQHTKSPADQIHANKLANNPDAFKKAVESIGNSDAFKNMTDGKSISELRNLVCGGGASLSKLLKEENTKILNNGKVVNKNKVKENPDASLENKSVEEVSFQL